MVDERGIEEAIEAGSSQIELDGQIEQAPPSSVFCPGPEDMEGFQFLIILVAPRPVISPAIDQYCCYPDG
ncbi:hypothetical protein C5167_038448 [Papaver somniferum]|uniref:Uncharacterized protein n=1 Tax=Papaver somniferum TaxID=3469 RepID=A0A4Y7IDB4_PAPSO|nr:hypothetical protein C5167_038448 [Papaver somniferum]